LLIWGHGLYCSHSHWGHRLYCSTWLSLSHYSPIGVVTWQVMPESIEVVHPGVMALRGVMSAIAAVGGETDLPIPSP
jgi:hypothetical protein